MVCAHSFCAEPVSLTYRWYGIMPYAFEDPDVARGLVKLIRKSRLYFVDQCGNPKCGKSERAPQVRQRDCLVPFS